MNAITEKPARLYYIDWLRVLAILVIFTFHGARLFDNESWHVDNAVTATGFTIYIQLIASWVMPLFFVLSGAGIYFALQSRATGHFLKERVTRLLVPWAIVGLLLFAPIQVYLERYSHGDFTGNFFQFIPQFFKGSYEFSDAGNFTFTGLHTWFLLFLFVHTMILLPLFTINKQTMKSLLSRFSVYFEKWWALLLLALPIWIMQWIGDVTPIGDTARMGGWNTLIYLLLLAYGYLVFSNVKILAVIKKYTFAFLAGAVALSVLMVIMRHVISINAEFESPGYFAILLRNAAIMWLWILAIIGLGMRYLQRNNKVLQYGNEAVLPFYILHQPIILLIGYFVVQWNINIGVKYVLVLAICFPIIMAIYHLLVKRFNVLRFLFGLRLNKKKTQI
jgi:glucans biosynthesis protein C